MLVILPRIAVVGNSKLGLLSRQSFWRDVALEFGTLERELF